MNDQTNEIWGPKQKPKPQGLQPVVMGAVPPQPVVRTPAEVQKMFEDARTDEESAAAQAAYEFLGGPPDPQTKRKGI